MANYLITGGAGFIGSNFVRFLLGKEPEAHIVNLDLLTYAGSQENLKDLPGAERHTLVQGDISDRPLVERLLAEHQIDIIVHFAAETHVDRSIAGPGQFIQTNVIGTYTLLEAARQYWLVKKSRPLEEVRFHHISTDEVYGTLQPGDEPWDEQRPYDPSSPYAASKASSDHLVRAYGRTYGMPFSITNCSNNYGPYQFPEKLIPLVILNAQHGKPLPVYGDGQQVRDWLHVEDHCEAIWLVVQRGANGETYNVGGGVQPPNLSIVEQICAILDEKEPESAHTPHKQLIRYVADRPGHDRRYAVNWSKLKRDLGWEPRHNLGQGLAETVAWYLEHPEWVEAVLKQADYQSWVDKNYTQRGGEK